MANHRDILGFDDRWFMVIGMLVIGFAMPFLFFNNSWADLASGAVIPHWATSYPMTIAYWLGARYWIIFYRRRIPEFSRTGQRIVWQTLTIIGYALVVDVVIGSSIHQLMTLEDPPSIAGFAGTYLLILFLLTVYEAVYLYTQWKTALIEQERVTQEHIRSQLEGLRNQVNPHFLFNSLNTLVSVIEEDPPLARSFVQHLSRVFRYVLENREEQLIPLDDELRFMEDYLFLQKERFRENLQVHIQVPSGLRSKMIIPLSLQLLFENAIKHNVISEDLPLRIDVKAEDDYLTVSNPVQPREQVMPSTRVGLDNIRKRYQFFTSSEVRVKATDDQFTVAIPLL